MASEEASAVRNFKKQATVGSNDKNKRKVPQAVANEFRYDVQSRLRSLRRDSSVKIPSEDKANATFVIELEAHKTKVLNKGNYRRYQ